MKKYILYIELELNAEGAHFSSEESVKRSILISISMSILMSNFNVNVNVKFQCQSESESMNEHDMSSHAE